MSLVENLLHQESVVADKACVVDAESEAEQLEEFMIP